MMWNFLVGGLLTDATILLYDGNPATPSLDRLWDFAAETGMTAFGTSAAYIAACMKSGVKPAEGRDLSKLQGRRLDGLAALPGRVPLGLRRRSARTRGCSPRAAARTS